MLLEQFRDDFANLPVEAQKKLSDNIAAMIARYQRESVESSNKKHIPLSDEPFIGIWADRDDMNDSSRWVREMRDNEWKR